MIWPFSKKTLSINEIINSLETINMPAAGVSVTPANCMRSPTVHAIVTAISRRIAVSPLNVLQKQTVNGKTTKTALATHPVSRVLNQPNNWQNRVTFWLDMTSELVRYGNLYAVKAAGRTGPVRRLVPISAGMIRGALNEQNEVIYTAQSGGTRPQTYTENEILHARAAARDFVNGDSPIHDVRNSIALEIAAEEYGGSFFANGAVPLMVFQLMAGFKDFKTDEEKAEFLESVQHKLGGNKKHKAFLLPKGMELADKSKTAIENNRSQFLESRQYQRTVIAGAWGVPPHLVGDLSRATFNNVEQQDSDFTINVVLPYARMIESAAEMSLLTESERANGIIIRFNLDAIQRADFKSRQEGLQIQRANGVISADEWREFENRNPLPAESGGDDYWQPANFIVAGDSGNAIDE